MLTETKEPRRISAAWLVFLAGPLLLAFVLWNDLRRYESPWRESSRTMMAEAGWKRIEAGWQKLIASTEALERDTARLREETKALEGCVLIWNSNRSLQATVTQSTDHDFRQDCFERVVGVFAGGVADGGAR